MTMRWKVPKIWAGQTIAVCACGPSMTRQVAGYLRGRCPVIAVNNTGIGIPGNEEWDEPLLPWADVLYGGDAKWWANKLYQERARAFVGLKVTMQHTLPFEEVLSLSRSERLPFDPRPEYLVSGGNSGYQAIHLAVHFGAAKIVLCGFDMRNGKQNGKHFFGSHPLRTLDSAMRYEVWKVNFANLAPVLKQRGVDVVNCTPKSSLTCFRLAGLEDEV